MVRSHKVSNDFKMCFFLESSEIIRQRPLSAIVTPLTGSHTPTKSTTPTKSKIESGGDSGGNRKRSSGGKGNGSTLSSSGASPIHGMCGASESTSFNVAKSITPSSPPSEHRSPVAIISPKGSQFIASSQTTFSPQYNVLPNHGNPSHFGNDSAASHQDGWLSRSSSKDLRASSEDKGGNHNIGLPTLIQAHATSPSTEQVQHMNKSTPSPRPLGTSPYPPTVITPPPALPPPHIPSAVIAISSDKL
jgi:hypothetical protein